MDSFCWNTTKQNVFTRIDDNFKQMIEVWTLLYGPDSEIFEEKCIAYSERIKEFSDALCGESIDDKKKIILEIENLYESLIRLSKELGMSCNFDENLDENQPLQKIYDWLTRTTSERKQIRADRLNIYEDLVAKELNLCKILNEEPMPSCNGTPSVSFLDQLKEHIEYLTNKKHEFEEMMKAKSENVVAILNRLELSAVHPVERFCVDPQSAILPYNSDTLKQIETHIEKLTSQENDMKNEADHLRELLSVIWARINEPYENRERIITTCKGYTKKEIRKLKAELQRCEEIKQRNLKFYIENVKQELSDWWARCLLSEDEKNKFSPYKAKHYSDEVLSIIELELEKVKAFYNKYVTIFEVIEKRKEAWERLLHLEAASKDSRRLLSRDGNRGGALLREEQERKKVQKELPRIEEFLKKKLDEFESQEHRPFTVYGENIRTMIENQYNEFHAKKDQAKKVAGAKVNSHSAAKKRRLPDSQQTQVGSKYRTPMSRPERNAATSSTASSRRDLSNASVSSSYSLFQEHLDGKNEIQKTPCRSTMTPSNVLKPHNSQGPAHSSPKTPRLTPYYKTRSNTTSRKTPQNRPPFKVGGSSSKIPTLTLPMKSPKGTAQLKTPRRNLPIII